jgi:hypothetical protein
MNRQKINCAFIPGYDQYEIRMGYDYGDKMDVAQPVIFQTQERGLAVPAMMSLEHGAAQMLFDDLWGMGLRPSRAFTQPGTEWLQQQLAKFIDQATSK